MGVDLVCTSNHCCIHLKWVSFSSGYLHKQGQLPLLDNQPEIHININICVFVSSGKNGGKISSTTQNNETSKACPLKMCAPPSTGLLILSHYFYADLAEICLLQSMY